MQAALRLSLWPASVPQVGFGFYNWLRVKGTSTSLTSGYKHVTNVFQCILKDQCQSLEPIPGYNEV